MRTWILCGAFVVAEAINPNNSYNVVISLFCIALLLIGMLADAKELKNL